jgi:hypothetical protein
VAMWRGAEADGKQPEADGAVARAVVQRCGHTREETALRDGGGRVEGAG